jgi:lipopolysaccharide/colanic/teichoic acid biosynthesis glycosyltransferase
MTKAAEVIDDARGGRGLSEFTQQLLAAMGLLCASPLIVVAAAAIVLEDGRPVFFTQKRVGKDGRLFSLWKLRTMRTNQKGAAVTVGGDRRVTRVGRVLRRLKLDELPQFWNVVIGDMTLIGARPEVPEFVNLEDPVWKMVLSRKPGITDFSTLMYRREEELLAQAPDPMFYYRNTVLPEKLALHLKYMNQRTLSSDLKLLGSTALPGVRMGEILPTPKELQIHSK